MNYTQITRLWMDRHSVIGVINGITRSVSVEKHMRKKIDTSEMKKKSYIGPCCSVNGAIIIC